MKSLKDFILESKDEELDDKICANIKSELEDNDITVFYVDTDENEDNEPIYVATCDYASFKNWEKLSDSDAIIDVVDNTGVSVVDVNDDSSLKYQNKRAFEIHFADKQ